jgi:amidase
MLGHRSIVPFRVALLLTLAASLVVAVTTPARSAPEPGTLAGIDLDAATIPTLQAARDDGDLTAVRLTQAYLQRIQQLDGQLGSVLFVDREGALAAARASDRRHRHGGLLGPLDGIPVLLKDNIDTAGLPTTAGSRLLLDAPPTDDAELVARLRAGGAVVLGKANLSEWANFRGFGSTSGWSAVGGLTANPHVLDRNPCGSSSGSAAAVAASLTQVAVGTETDGSVVCPSSATGVVGHKPTIGLVPGDGIVPISFDQDTAGPIGRHVVDVALLLEVIGGVDGPAALDTDALDGARIGRWTAFDGLDGDVDRVQAEAVAVLEAAGATVVPVTLPYQDVIGANEFPALLGEFEDDLETYLAERPGGPDQLEELIAGNLADPVELRWFGQELFEISDVAPPRDDPSVVAARAAAHAAATASIDETLATYELDAIMAPTNSPAWPTTLVGGDAFLFGSSSPAAVAGYPNVTVPAGGADGDPATIGEGPLPLGISLMASAGQDGLVLDLAASFEAAADARLTPGFVPSIGGDGDTPSQAPGDRGWGTWTR